MSPRSDVYSLAATLWTLIAGEPPSYRDGRSLADEFPDVTPELEGTLRRALELQPERRVSSIDALAAALGSPLGASSGVSLARSVPAPTRGRTLLESIVRTAAGVFEAAASSIALRDEATGELVFEAAWGAGADEIVGVRLSAGAGIAGAAVAGGEGLAVAACRTDPRFEAQIAAGTGYVPHTMLVVPLKHGDVVMGALSILDRRDGRPYGAADVPRAALFADLTVAVLDASSG